MAKQKRNVWDELLELGRRVLQEIDDLLDPRPVSRGTGARACAGG